MRPVPASDNNDTRLMKGNTQVLTARARKRTAATVMREYLELTKPRVVSLIVFTAIVGMFLSTPAMVPWSILLLATLGIGLAAASAAAINHLVEQRSDALMARTRARPLPTGQLSSRQAIVFAAVLGTLSMSILGLGVNALTAVLTFVSLIGYSIIYTVFLKRRTPQNIVIGGAAGAAPPVLGWTAVTGEIASDALLLFLIIFVWTPPHFWALALYRQHEYAMAGIPMLPVTHGVQVTKAYVLNYTLALVIVTLLPFLTGMSGFLYLIAALLLGAGFVYYALALRKSDDIRIAMQTFHYSISYLVALFSFLLLDHYIHLVWPG